MHDGRFVARLLFYHGRRGRWSAVEVERERGMKGKRVGNELGKALICKVGIVRDAGVMWWLRQRRVEDGKRGKMV